MNQLILFLFMAAFYSCTPPIQSTLLSEKKECTESNGCITALQKEIPGDLSITPDSSQMTVNVEQSDSVEISGSCRDLGRYDNRIIVQVYEGEVESGQPYLDNSSSFNCVNSQTTMPPTGVNINGSRCFWNTLGSGIVEPTTEFSRCFNGRFAFRVRLGKILRDGSNSLMNYLVRFKLRTATPAADSPYGRVVISRSLSKPTFTVQKPADEVASAQLRCEILVNPFRGAMIGYELQKEITATTGVMPPSNPNIYPTSPIPYQVAFPDLDFGKDQGTSVQKFYDTDVIHGVTYSYSVQATDLKYTPNPPQEVSGYTNVVVCKTPMPRPIFPCGCLAGGPCFPSVDRGPSVGNSFEWHYMATANWPASNPGGGILVPTCSVSNCSVTLGPGEKRSYSVRAVHSSGYKGEWMQQTIDCVGLP